MVASRETRYSSNASSGTQRTHEKSFLALLRREPPICLRTKSGPSLSLLSFLRLSKRTLLYPMWTSVRQDRALCSGCCKRNRCCPVGGVAIAGEELIECCLRDAALGLQLVCDFTDPIVPPFRELRAAVIENGMPFGGDIGQALCLQPRGNFAPDVIVDLVGRRPVKELLPELFLGGGSTVHVG
jgi:hypothetical protein